MTPYYDADGITIYHGDCAEIAPQLGRFDLLCTDPPYGIGAPRKAAARRSPATPPRKNKPASKLHGGRPPMTVHAPADWDDSPPSPVLIEALVEIARWQCIFGGNYFDLPLTGSWLVWDKDNIGTPFADVEMAWTNYGSAARLKRHRWNGMLQADMANKEPRYHPTQKPLAVMSWAISLCPERPTSVFDPFMGSGTTLRACKDLGIRATGIEREERYCEVAARRMAQGVLL